MKFKFLLLSFFITCLVLDSVAQNDSVPQMEPPTITKLDYLGRWSRQLNYTLRATYTVLKNDETDKCY